MDILDTSALFAFFRKEKGGEKIKNLIEKSRGDRLSIFMHAVNFIEFVYKCQQLYGPKITNQMIADLETPFFGIVNYLNTDLNFYAAHLKANYHLSLADATGLAHAKIMKGTFWTADTALKAIAKKEDISLECIR